MSCSGWLTRSSAPGAVARILVAAVLVLGSATALAAPAVADVPTVNAFLLRDGAQSVYRQDGLGGTQVHAGLENDEWQGQDYLAARFYSPSADGTPDVEVVLTSGLAPGTYTASRIPGQAQSILDFQSFDNCGSDGTGTVTVTRSAWADDGTPTLLDATFERDACQGMPVVHGVIRWNSATPLGLASAPTYSTVPATVVVNSSADLPVTVTAAGNAPTTFGTLAVNQKPTPDGTRYWTVGADTCSGTTVAPGATCTITMHIAPTRPNGYPKAEIDASLVLPDGQPDPVLSTVSAFVAPLGGQPIGLRAIPGVHRITLSWAPPQVLGAGWTGGKRLTYAAYLVGADGTATDVRSVSGQTTLSIPEPDRFTGTFVVRANEPGTAQGPASVPATATTARREVLVPENQDGLATLLPGSSAAPSVFVGPYDERVVDDPTLRGLTVARDQSLLAFTREFTNTAGKTSTIIDTEQLEGDVSRGWTDRPGDTGAVFKDGNPSFSPDGTRITFAHTENGVTTTRVVLASTNANPALVPNSAALSQPTFAADGVHLVAVRTTNVVTTDLVTVDPTTGAQTVIPGTTGLTSPDVAADGRVVAVRWATVDGSTVSELVTLAPGGVPTPVPGTTSGWNTRPRFSPDGATIFYAHAADSGTAADAYSVDPVTGTTTAYSQGGGASTPFVLTEDAPDTTAPTATMTSPGNLADLTSSVRATWVTADHAVRGAVTSGVASVDVRVRTASYAGAFSAYSYPAVWQHTTAPAVTSSARAGVEYCFSVRARDRAGNTSAWTADRCATEPIDDRALSSKATRATGGAYFARTISRAKATRTTFTRAKVAATHVAVLVTTCAACGAVDVWIGKTHLGRVATAGHPHNQQLFWLPVTRSLTGTLLVRTASKAQVLLDGVVAVR